MKMLSIIHRSTGCPPWAIFCSKVSFISSLVGGDISLKLWPKGITVNAEVIEALLKLAEEIAKERRAGKDLGLNVEEKAFYDAITKPRAIKDFYTNDALIQIT